MIFIVSLLWIILFQYFDELDSDPDNQKKLAKEVTSDPQQGQFLAKPGSMKLDQIQLAEGLAGEDPDPIAGLLTMEDIKPIYKEGEETPNML